MWKLVVSSSINEEKHEEIWMEDAEYLSAH
jgi:hypothetical protein